MVNRNSYRGLYLFQMSDEQATYFAKRLTPRQARFVKEYLIDEHATRAARRAGYSEKIAASSGSENLRKPHIVAAIQEQLDAQQARTLITADRILREYGRIGFLDTRRLFNADGSLKRIVDMDDDTQAAIAGIDVVTMGNAESGVGEITKIRISDRKGALDSMARHFGLFNDKTTVDLSGTLALRRAKEMTDEELAAIAAGATNPPSCE